MTLYVGVMRNPPGVRLVYFGIKDFRMNRVVTFFEGQRHIFFALFVLVAFLVPAALAPARAQIQGPPGENSVCALYDAGTPMDCSFSNFAMCEAAVSGTGGSCQPNTPVAPGRQLFQRVPQLIPTDPLGLYRDPSQGLPPVPPPP